MSNRAKLLKIIGINDIDKNFERLYQISFRLQNLLDRNKNRASFLNKIRHHTHVNYQRLAGLWDICEKVGASRLPGAYIECGVWKGGCAAILAQKSKEQGYTNKLYFFDSFKGLPVPTKQDGIIAASLTGKVSAAEEYLRDLLFKKLKIKKSRVNIVKGWFQDTLPKSKKQIGQIAILRLDGDWYSSTKVCLENLYDQVIVGGYIIIDDYNYWEGCKKAVDEFREKRQIDSPLIRQDMSGVYFVKK